MSVRRAIMPVAVVLTVAALSSVAAAKTGGTDRPIKAGPQERAR
jgi:hypothetical protein